MKQHINFLTSIVPVKKQPSSHVIVIAVMMTLFLLLITSMVTKRSKDIENERLQTAQKAHHRATLAFQALARTYPLLASDTPLAVRVATIEQQLHDKEHQFAVLTHTLYRKPFSTYMTALARTVPTGLWLTTINIDQHSGNHFLEGLTVKPLLMTVFLKQLQKADPFTQEIFGLFTMKKVMDKGGLHQFEVANQQLLNTTRS